MEDIETPLVAGDKLARVIIKNEEGEIIAVLFTGAPVLIRECNGVKIEID